MRRTTPVAALAALGFASVHAAGNDLESRVTASDGLVAYNVPMVDGVQAPCCYTIHGRAVLQKGCNLDGRGGSFGIIDDDRKAAFDDTLTVYLRVEHGHIGRVQALGASCPVQSVSTVRWIASVDPASSIAMLSSLVDRNATGDPDDHGLVALAYHADAAATRSLAVHAEASHRRKEREQALFWLGQTRGVEGADVIERYATTDPDPKLREQAIFALSQSSAPDAYAHILAMAHKDPSEHVRGQAYFWLAQMDDARAKDDIIAALKSESSDEVREEIVAALSQLEDSADEALIAVLRGDFPRAVKKQALFWLGQSGSAEAMAYFDEALK
ncbi:MAG TPA: HEAT repeat domain-containing protein [Steroidobacteraceae bacterium]|nr:HEAT repeat domain-containing protein [Steroidobacteraceae bacterium]